MSSEPPDSLPSGIVRPTVITLTLEALRKEIAKGTWGEYLPNERQLCHLFRVSRPSLRQALKSLDREGLIDVQHGKRTRICERPASPGEAGTESRVVAVLSTQVQHEVERRHLMMFNELHNALLPHAWHLETHFNDKLLVRSPQRYLERVVLEHPARCWLLVSSSPAIQAWFAERGLPCLVLGTCHEGISLPSFDLEYRAVGRHAAGFFLGRGFENIVLTMPKTDLAGDRETLEGFRDVLSRHPRGREVRLTLLRHEHSTRDFIHKMETLLPSKKGPVALFVLYPSYTMTAMLYALRRGYQVPKDISILARDYYSHFEYLDQMPAHYAADRGMQMERLSRLVLQLSKSGFLRNRPYRMIPKLVEGETVARLDEM